MNISLNFLKATFLTGISAVGLMTVAGFGVACAEQDHQQVKVEMSKKAQIKIEEAIKAASQEVPGTIIKAELETEHGPLMWEFEIVTQTGDIKEVHLDGQSGKVLALNSDEDAKNLSSKTIHAGKTGKGDEKMDDNVEKGAEEKPAAEKE